METPLAEHADLPERIAEPVRSIVAELAADPATLGVCLFGSWASGRARPESDVDLLRIVESDRPMKSGFEREGIPIEIVTQPLDSLRASLKVFGWRNHTFLANVALAVRVLYDRDGRTSALIAEARAAREQGPPPPHPVELVMGRSVTRNKLAKVRRLIEDADPHGVGPLMAEVLFFLLLGAYCKARRRWFNRIPLLLDEVQRSDPGFYAHCRRFLDAPEKGSKLAALARIVEALAETAAEATAGPAGAKGGAPPPGFFAEGEGYWGGF